MHVKVTRGSVCMGDDCFAPHEEQLSYLKDTKLSDWMHSALTAYLPKVVGYHIWAVYGNATLLGYVAYDNMERYTIHLVVEDQTMSSMLISEVHCSYYSGLAAERLRLEL